jgi:hypothetical protein
MSTLDDFFGTDDSNKCNECGSTENLIASDIVDEQTRKPLFHICQKCQSKHDAEHAEELAKRNAETERNIFIANTDK